MLLRFLHFSYFCIRREETLSKTYLEFKERYAYLVVGNLGNSQLYTRIA